MQIKHILLLLSFLVSSLGFAQDMQLSPLSKISLLTVGTADELHSKFGHSAIRVYDPVKGMDIVFGYGQYSSFTDNFYLKFTQGKLNYTISAERLQSFLDGYKIENRWVREQDLKLNREEQDKLFSFLQTNYKPENREYKYDFLSNNCATKLPEIFKQIYGDKLQFNYDHLKEQFTFRQLLRQNLDLNSWSNFGIDLALGSVIDRKASPYEHMFLPYYVYLQLPNTTLNGRKLTTTDNLIVDVVPAEKKSNLLFSPFVWLAIFMATVLFITYNNFKKHTRNRGLDFILFLVSGLAGILILFLWFFTDHWETKLNFNSLWAFAPNIFVAFFLLKKQPPTWIKNYLWLLLTLIILTLILWVFQIQMFSPLIIFILVAFVIRYLFLLNFLRQKTRSNS